MVGSRAAAGTPCVERSLVNLRSSGVESERGCTVKASVGFIGAGVGVGVGVGVGEGSCLARRDARGVECRGVLWRRQGASNTWAFVSASVQTLAGITNVRILPRVLRKSLPGT